MNLVLGELADPRSREVENELQRVVHTSQLVERQVSDLLAQHSRIDGADHLAHHACRLAIDLDLRVKARGRGRSRRWAHNDRRQREQIVCLHDHRKATSMLHTTAPTRQRDRMNITADHAAAP